VLGVKAVGNLKASDADMFTALLAGIFHPQSNPVVWLTGWASEANRLQGIAATTTRQAEYWNAGGVPDADPFKWKGR